MSAILQGAVDTVNSVSRTTISLFSSAISVNYYVGDTIFTVLKYFYSHFISLIHTAFIAVQIILEDLVIFLQECFESLSNLFSILCGFVDHFVDGIIYCCQLVKISIFSITSGFTSGFNFIFNAVSSFTAQAASVFNLIGSSLILLTDLVPRSISSIYTFFVDFFTNSATLTKLYGIKAVDGLRNTPTELYIGLVIGAIAIVAMGRTVVSTVRRRNVTWNSVVRLVLTLICYSYVLFIRLCGETFRLIFRITETTLSNLRVPMFAHAGDSDEDGEDRENLVGAIDESDDEDRERQSEKRRNYELLLERTNNRKKGRKNREGSESIEDRLLMEVEREREDKLCVICVDKEKCIMILPCRHLCICESCQIPLRRHRNICPICRKEIKQMIKAYL